MVSEGSRGEDGGWWRVGIGGWEMRLRGQEEIGDLGLVSVADRRWGPREHRR